MSKTLDPERFISRREPANEVAITGLGLFTTLGLDPETAFNNGCEGYSAMRLLTEESMPFADINAYPVEPTEDVLVWRKAAELKAKAEAKGEVVSFEEALKHAIEADPKERAEKNLALRKAKELQQATGLSFNEALFQTVMPSRVGAIFSAKPEDGHLPYIPHTKLMEMLKEENAELAKKKPDPAIIFAYLSTMQALRDAGLVEGAGGVLPEELRELVGVHIGTGIGPMQGITRATMGAFSEWKPKTAMPPNYLPYNGLPNMPTGVIADQIGALGPPGSETGACAAGMEAIHNGYLEVANGDTVTSVVGGTEAPDLHAVSAFGNGGMTVRGYLDNPAAASRPWDIDRSGFGIGAGAGTLVLTNKAYAEATGMKIYALLAGTGLSNCNPTREGLGITSGTKRGQNLAMKRAMQSAGVNPGEIDFVKAHGTSTKLGDVVESEAIAGMFPSNPRVGSFKSFEGHTLGACGGVETVLATLAMSKQLFPGTINLDNQDPKCAINVLKETMEMKVRHALLLYFGFGGVDGSLVLKQYDPRLKGRSQRP